MPQLNPTPWFYTMLATWLTLSLIIQPKLLSFTSTNLPSHKAPAPTKTTPWTWPWT
uniref:ATP synthase complex subunit 8 n=1 Tax=Bubo bubo TaxID=30461 RepID=A0A060Q0Y1_BUBBB|nr:ATP synthase F0 subunit 8 [Bubo bubo]AWM99535.1 ATP synthase F0 subunit 8 [Bubo bubo]QFQ52172.1 ATP synthase F0 subunit 8 [Bubo bubo]QFQ52185.1 ATP synthase F0 subunit 8 [Bubo bubo]QFQ52198.1 ATP synthase F0 subunit 8 [Bubo bubo]QFQ52211.1 ATP synthase F0 subunit 8 [Bubo bubo]